MRALTPKFFALLIIALAVAACATQPRQNPAPDMSLSQNFIPMAASSDKFEIKSSKMALAKSHDPAVRRIAHRMIKDHTASSRKMAAILAANGMGAPPTEMAHHHKALAILRDATDFDQQYLETQEVAHRQAIALFKTYSERGDNADLRAFAAKTLPVLYQHLEMVQKARQNAANG